MAKRKKVKVSNNFAWLKDLQDQEYKYIIMPKKNRTEFYATKANQKKDGTFRDTAKFDVMKLVDLDEWIPGNDSKGVFIHLDEPLVLIDATV